MSENESTSIEQPTEVPLAPMLAKFRSDLQASRKKLLKDKGNGGKAVFFDQNDAKKHLKGKEIMININLGKGTGVATVWGCDLTYDYVKINAEYHT